MRVGKEHALSGESIDIRRSRLRVTVEWTYPIIEVVNRNEEDVGVVGRLRERQRGEALQREY